MASFSNASVAAGPSRPHKVIGVWTKRTLSASTTNAIEVEARLESSPIFSLPTHPPTTYTISSEPHSAPNALGQFLGAGALEACRSSRETISVPPPYSPGGYVPSNVTEKQPKTYSDDSEEPLTLARMLFMYGFLFFPFWLAGIYILCSPLLPTPDWEVGKTEVEKAQLLQLHRKTELKWARRCLLAMFGLLVTIFILVLIIRYGIMRAT